MWSLMHWVQGFGCQVPEHHGHDLALYRYVAPYIGPM